MKVEWERTAREAAFSGRVVDVFRDTVRVRRDGDEKVAVYDLVHHPGATAIVPLYDDGSVALLHQFRYATGGELWEIPAGTLEPGEEPLACARRELEEEIGQRAERWSELARFYTAPGFCDELLIVYLAEDLSPGHVGPDPDEHLEVVRVPLVEALAWIASGRIADAKTIVGLLRARDRLDQEGRAPAT